MRADPIVLDVSQRQRERCPHLVEKLALVLLTREQARRDPFVAVNGLHPGAIATGISLQIEYLVQTTVHAGERGHLADRQQRTIHVWLRAAARVVA
jgi:NAD(P)-dependent dehydrogenase (short-subunit alcohol dehydrogenase family)